MTDTNNARFCFNCGARLVEGARFCHICGTRIDSPGNPEHPEPGLGKQHKLINCPNCAAPIDSFVVKCPYCGTEVTRDKANMTVSEFKAQLMAIEQTRVPHERSIFDQTPDPADQEKLALIKNFPIPNTIEDITEFFMLCIANIDVSLSKNNFRNRINANAKASAVGMPMAISDAWVTKMEQVYMKAEMMFSGESIFGNIQSAYRNKMKELNRKL